MDDMEWRVIAMLILLNQLLETIQWYYGQRRIWQLHHEATWIGEDQEFVEGISAAIRIMLDLGLRDLEHPLAVKIPRPFAIRPEDMAGGGQHDSDS